MTMWCNSCGKEFGEKTDAAITPCSCGSTIRQSWKPQPYYWWGQGGGGWNVQTTGGH